MPQKKSYFALQLPKGWWVFGLDLALHGDIDAYQFNFFSELVKEKVDSVSSFFPLLNRFCRYYAKYTTSIYSSSFDILFTTYEAL